MILRLFPVALSVVILAPGLLHAQSAPAPTGGLSPGSSSAPDPSAGHKMYEDVEIFRRILDRKLHPLYPSHTYPSMGGMLGMQSGMLGMQSGMMGMQGGMGFGMTGSQMALISGMNPLVIPIRTLEGVYLKGQGVVYTVTLSSLQLPARAETARPPVSEWESVRRELRNEKEAPKKPAEMKPAALADVLLKVLAENGRHFAQLGENESLTLVLTRRDQSSSSAVQQFFGTQAKKASKPPTAPKDDPPVSSKERDLELLGDLHLKQGKAEEAIRAFQQAVHLKPAPKQAAALHRKLAQCYLMLEQDEKARAELDELNAFYKELIALEGAKDKPAPDVKPAAVALPVKLIISAPKKLLDQVGEGKIPFEEFRRRASVETLTFDSHRR